MLHGGVPEYFGDFPSPKSVSEASEFEGCIFDTHLSGLYQFTIPDDPALDDLEVVEELEEADYTAGAQEETQDEEEKKGRRPRRT